MTPLPEEIRLPRIFRIPHSFAEFRRLSQDGDSLIVGAKAPFTPAHASIEGPEKPWFVQSRCHGLVADQKVVIFGDLPEQDHQRGLVHQEGNTPLLIVLGRW